MDLINILAISGGLLLCIATIGIMWSIKKVGV